MALQKGCKCINLDLDVAYSVWEKNQMVNFINDDCMLKKKSELIPRCRHTNKNFLSLDCSLVEGTIDTNRKKRYICICKWKIFYCLKKQEVVTNLFLFFFNLFLLHIYICVCACVCLIVIITIFSIFHCIF